MMAHKPQSTMKESGQELKQRSKMNTVYWLVPRSSLKLGF